MTGAVGRPAPRPRALRPRARGRCPRATTRRARFDDCLGRWASVGFDYGVVEETMTRAGIGVGGLRRRHLDEHGEEVLNLYYRLAAATTAAAWARRRRGPGPPTPWSGCPTLPVVATSRETNERSVRAALAAGLEPVGTDRRRPGRASRPRTVLRAPRVESPDVVRRADPRVGARPVVRGQRHRGSGRLPPGRAAPRGRGDPRGARGGDGRRRDDAPCSCAGRAAGSWAGFWVADRQPAARGTPARPTGS